VGAGDGRFMIGVPAKPYAAAAIPAISAAFSASCSTPFHLVDAYTTSTPRPQSLDVAGLAPWSYHVFKVTAV